MGRKRKAWLTNGNGRRIVAGRLLPGYYVEWRDDAGGHKSKAFRTLRLARDYCRGLNERFDRRGGQSVLRITLAEALEEFSGVLGKLARNTKTDMLSVVGTFAGATGTERLVGEMTVHEIEDYLTDRGPYLSESTLAKQFRYLRRFFRWCVDRGYCHHDPTRQVAVKPSPGRRELGAMPSDEDIARLLSAIDVPLLRLAAAIGLTTGLDRGVVADLRPENFDLPGRCITTRRKKTARSHPVTLHVPLHAALLPDLARYLAQSPPGVPLFRAYLHRGWYVSAKRAAGPPWDHLRVADFRKIASGRLQRVLPLTSVQRLLGHSSPQTTAAHYSPVDPAALLAIDKLTLPSYPAEPPAKIQTPA